MSKQHQYHVRIRWTGNQGDGTSGYRNYSRNHEIVIAGKPVIVASSDPTFRGDPERYNPEEMLVASLSSCHMLWYLHLCAEAGVVVESYLDAAEGTMVETPEGGGRFSNVTLRPGVVIRSGEERLADDLHHRAHDLCFIANSVNFPVACEPTVSTVSQSK